jgi:DNA adenine methylase
MVRTRLLSRPVLRYFGGKYRLAPWIHSLMPAHEVYVEAFGGAGSVLLTKKPARSEIFNDLDGDVVNFFEVLRDRTRREQLIEACYLTPYARKEFEAAFEPSEDSVERARRMAIRAAMGFGSAGGTKESTGFRTEADRCPYHDWSNYPRVLVELGERLKGVLIEQRPATQVMLQHDGPGTLHYVDPPYMFETRVRASLETQRYYRHEMTDWQHMDLLSCLENLKGMVMLSGYWSESYQSKLSGWTLHQKSHAKAAYRGAKSVIESLWLNKACTERLSNGA